MNKATWIIIILALVSVNQCQNNSSALPTNGSSCSPGSILNKTGVCCVIDPLCEIFNRDVGIC
jgi:hypothetical protein